MAKLFQLHRNFYLQNVGMNWANTMNSMDGGAQKSLAEIQAEEARQDRERQERERREKKARQKDLSLAQASVWGSASSNLSWANKTSSVSNFQQVLQQQPAAPPQQAVLQPSHSSSSIGFWDNNDPPPAPKPQPQQAPPPQQQQKQPSQHNNKKNMKNKKEETKVAAIFKEKGKPKNEFDEWCITALEKLDPQVDIPTFLGFLIEVESPYEVTKHSFFFRKKVHTVSSVTNRLFFAPVKFVLLFFVYCFLNMYVVLR